MSRTSRGSPRRSRPDGRPRPCVGLCFGPRARGGGRGIDRPGTRRTPDRRALRRVPRTDPRSSAFAKRASQSLAGGVACSWHALDPATLYAVRGEGPARVGPRWQRVPGPALRLWRDGRRPRASARRRGGARARRPRDALRDARRGDRRGRGAPRRAVRPAAVAVPELGVRGDDGRDADHACRHRPRADRQGRGLVPRQPRRARLVVLAGRRRGGSARAARAGAEHRRGRAGVRRGAPDRPLQRPRGGRTGARRGRRRRRAG